MSRDTLRGSAQSPAAYTDPGQRTLESALPLLFVFLLLLLLALKLED